jgi:Flp pilus assembly protein TadD
VFCRNSGVPFVTIVLLGLALAGCTREPEPAVERLAVLPFENLSSDVQLDWAGRAASAALVYDLSGAKGTYAQAVDSLSAAQSMQASRVLEGYFFDRNGRLEIRATLEDPGKAKAVRSLDLSGSVAAGFLPLVNQLAQGLSAEARPFGTTNPDAFRLWGEALASADRQKMLANLEAATQADPQFVAASVARASILTAAGNRDEARQVVAAAEGGHPNSIDQAQLAYAAASLTQDAKARLKALTALARSTPSNSNLFQELAQLRIAQRDFPGAVRDYREAARLNPEEPRLWNELGYALSYAQDLAGARQALEQYQRLAPGDINALDSLGEVSFYLGDFSGAGKYFLAAAAKNPAELVKAAQARMMAGELGDADALYQKYLQAAQGAQRARAAYQQAEWEYLTGRHKSGFARMEKLMPELDADGQSLALSQLSIWKLEMGDDKAAADLADHAAARAVTPQARNLSALCKFISQGTASSSGSRLADAFGRLFARKFQEAVPLLEAVYRETNPAADGQVRLLLAWAYVESGRMDDAGPLLARCAIPLSSGEAQFASLAFPRYFFLRGKVREKEGKQDEARKSYALFLKYAGDVPDVFGDEAQARKNLGATY